MQVKRGDISKKVDLWLSCIWIKKKVFFSFPFFERFLCLKCTYCNPLETLIRLSVQHLQQRPLTNGWKSLWSIEVVVYRLCATAATAAAAALADNVDDLRSSSSTPLPSFSLSNSSSVIQHFGGNRNENSSPRIMVPSKPNMPEKLRTYLHKRY